MQSEQVAPRVDPRVKHSKIVLGLWTFTAAMTALMYSMGFDTGIMSGIVIGSGGALLVAYSIRSVWGAMGSSSSAILGIATGCTIAIALGFTKTHTVDAWIVAVSVGLVYGTYLWGRFAPRPTSPPLDTFKS